MLEGCSPDLRTVRGALAAASDALALDDPRSLFEVLDCRSRAALYSISRDRLSAAQLIQAEYAATDRAAALEELGDAARSRDAADLFSMRCPRACRARLAADLGAPLGQVVRGDEVEVFTARGGRVRLHRCQNEWGLAWNPARLSDESSRAARELAQIRRNATVYQRRRALAAALAPGAPP